MSAGHALLAVLAAIAVIAAGVLALCIRANGRPVRVQPDYADMGVPVSQRRIRIAEDVRPDPVPRPTPQSVPRPWTGADFPIGYAPPPTLRADAWYCTVYVVRDGSRFKLAGGRATTALMTIAEARAEALAGAVRTWGPGQYDIRLTPATREPAVTEPTSTEERR